jgi:hypothetical protein
MTFWASDVRIANKKEDMVDLTKTASAGRQNATGP